MKFHALCKAFAWLAGVYAAISVGILANMLAWKVAVWWKAF